jgi:hypothetical protein
VTPDSGLGAFYQRTDKSERVTFHTSDLRLPNYANSSIRMLVLIRTVTFVELDAGTRH